METDDMDALRRVLKKIIQARLDKFLFDETVHGYEQAICRDIMDQCEYLDEIPTRVMELLECSEIVLDKKFGMNKLRRAAMTDDFADMLIDKKHHWVGGSYMSRDDYKRYMKLVVEDN